MMVNWPIGRPDREGQDLESGYSFGVAQGCAGQLPLESVGGMEHGYY